MSDNLPRHDLELQAHQIERVMARHEVEAEVTGGVTEGRRVSFDLYTRLSASWERLQQAATELKTTLGVPEVAIGMHEGRWRVQITPPPPPPVSLLPLLDTLPPLPPVTAVLGLGEDGDPLVVHFAPDEVAHLVITGGPAAGKTTLLRTLVASLALTNRQAQVQLVVMHPRPVGAPREALHLLHHLPHLMLPLVRTGPAAQEALAFLVEEMGYRLERRRQRPAILVVIDELDALLATGGRPIIGRLSSLLQAGPQAGIHLVLSLTHFQSSPLNSLLQAHLPIRLVGRTPNAAEARAASGARQSGAEMLAGRGAFVAAAYGQVQTSFQAAYMSEVDLAGALAHLQRASTPVLQAQPLNLRPTLSEENGAPRAFAIRPADGRVTFDLPSPHTPT